MIFSQQVQQELLIVTQSSIWMQPNSSIGMDIINHGGDFHHFPMFGTNGTFLTPWINSTPFGDILMTN